LGRTDDQEKELEMSIDKIVKHEKYQLDSRWLEKKEDEIFLVVPKI